MIEGGGLGVYEPTAIGPIDVQVAERRRRRRWSPTKPTAVARRQAVPVVLPGPGRRVGRAPTSARCATSSPRTACAPTTFAHGDRRALCDTGLGARAAAAVGRRHDHRARARRRPRRRHRRQQPGAPRRRDRRRRRRQGGAVPAAVRRVRRADRVPLRHARVHGRSRVTRRRGAVRHVSRMFVTGANLTVPFGTSSCARATGSARRRWRAARSRRRCSASRGRPASSAA